MSSKSHFFKQDNSELIDGLIHHYNFEETSGLITSDNIGSIDGDIQGGISLGEVGKVGNSFSYDGISGNINFNGNLDITSFPFSIKTWVYINDVNSNFYLLSGNKPTSYNGVSILNFAGGALYVRLGDGLGASAGNRADYREDFPSLSNGWNHVFINFNAFGDLDMYTNGVFQSSSLVSGSGTSIDLIGAEYRLATSGTGVFYDMNLDEFGVYNKSKEVGVINEIYQKENVGQSIL